MTLPLGSYAVWPGFDHSTFDKNRSGLLRHRGNRRFFDEVVLQVDSTIIARP